MTAMTTQPGSQGALSDDQVRFTEEWESVSPASQWVIKTDMRGDEAPEEVQQGDRFYITTRDRMLTQHKVKDKRNDPFTNGAFRPQIVPEDVTVETNPNAMSDSDILSVFKSSDLAWSEWMRVIDSPATLQRMVHLADESPEAEVSHKRYQHMVERFKETHPKTSLRSSDEELNNFLYGKREGGAENISSRPRNRAGGGYTGGH